jgi:hypothetical protein
LYVVAFACWGESQQHFSMSMMTFDCAKVQDILGRYIGALATWRETW